MGGWTALNLATKEQVHVPLAWQLRAEIGTKATTTTDGKPTVVKVSPATVETNNGPATKRAWKKKASAETTAKKVSQIEATLRVLTKSKEPMNCQAMVEAMTTKELWTSPGGKTPHTKLDASILREINTKGKDARCKRVDRGQLVATGSEA